VAQGSLIRTRRGSTDKQKRALRRPFSFGAIAAAREERGDALSTRPGSRQTRKWFSQRRSLKLREADDSAIRSRLEICTFRHNIKPMTGRTTKMMAMNERNTERQRSALDRIEGVCVRLASSTNVEALRRGLADIRVLIASKPQ